MLVFSSASEPLASNLECGHANDGHYKILNLRRQLDQALRAAGRCSDDALGITEFSAAGAAAGRCRRPVAFLGLSNARFPSAAWSPVRVIGGDGQ